MVMHKVGANGTKAQAPAKEAKAVRNFAITERMAQIFTLLTWNQSRQENWLMANAGLTQEQMVAKLEPMLDQ